MTPDLRDPGPTPEIRVARIAASLRAAGHDVRQVRPWRSGVDCFVDLVASSDDQSLVVRSPRVETIDTSYDGPTDFAAVLIKEAAALQLAEAAGVPVPRVYDLHRGSGSHDPTWMLQSLVVGDVADGVHGQEGGRRVGSWVRALHEIRPTRDPLRPPADWADVVTLRISHRIEAVRRYTDLPSGADVVRSMARVLEARSEFAVALLHLDVRDANIVVHDGEPVALLDFANAMTGDPMFELARIRRFGGLTPNFLQGYGSPRLLDDPATSQLLDFYELDTATLLTLVGAEETDDHALHRDNLERTRVLCAALSEAG